MSPAIVLAAEGHEYTLLQPLPCIQGTSTGGECATTPTIDLNGYIGYIFKFAIALAAFLAVIMIIWGGVETMTSEVPFIKSNGKDKIQNAVIGLVMVLASYLILVTIDPRLVEINTSIDKLKINDAAKEYGGEYGHSLYPWGGRGRRRVGGRCPSYI